MDNYSPGELPRRILVFRVGHLGDTVIALPALWAIKRKFPRAHIALLSNLYTEADRIGPGNLIPKEGLIHEWITYPSNDKRGGIVKMARLLATLRQKRFDTLAYLAPRIRTASDIRRDLLFFRLTGIRKLIADRGFEQMPQRTNGESLAPVEHEADHLLRRLSLSGIPIPSRGQTKMDLALTADESRQADIWFTENVPLFGSGPLVGFGAGSKWPSKVWPEERFVEVGKRLIQKQNIYPIVFGGAEDRALGERLILAWRRGANAAGELPVRQAAGALAQCRLYVGNDTGTMHIAAAVETPCVAIMSALDWPGHWNPYGAGHTVLRRSVPCEGCLLKVCERERMRCLNEITVEEVVNACESKLRAKSKGVRAKGEGERAETEVPEISCSLLALST